MLSWPSTNETGHGSRSCVERCLGIMVLLAEPPRQSDAGDRSAAMENILTARLPESHNWWIPGGGDLMKMQNKKREKN